MVTCYDFENEGTVDIDYTTLDEIDSIYSFVYSEEKKRKNKVKNAGLTDI